MIPLTKFFLNGLSFICCRLGRYFPLDLLIWVYFSVRLLRYFSGIFLNCTDLCRNVAIDTSALLWCDICVICSNIFPPLTGRCLDSQDCKSMMSEFSNVHYSLLILPIFIVIPLLGMSHCHPQQCCCTWPFMHHFHGPTIKNNFMQLIIGAVTWNLSCHFTY